MSPKNIFPLKMVPKADAAYLEFQTHTSRYSNSQSTVHITPDNYRSPLPHKHSRSVVHSVNTVPLTAVQCAFCKRLYTEPPGRVSIYIYCKALQQITCHRLRAFLYFVFCLLQLLAVFLLASRAAHKSQLFVVFRV